MAILHWKQGLLCDKIKVYAVHKHFGLPHPSCDRGREVERRPYSLQEPEFDSSGSVLTLGLLNGPRTCIRLEYWCTSQLPRNENRERLVSVVNRCKIMFKLF